jgi:hypothetical protein
MSDESILEDLKDHFDTAEWADIRAEGTKDMRVLSGDVWQAMDPAGTKQRKDANRPMLALDELGQYINQGVNGIKANPRGIKFSEAGNGASSKGAQYYADKAREIEYRSHAHTAYAMAAENMFQRSYGFVRLSTKYAHGESFDDELQLDVSLFNQDIWVEGFPNPDVVLPDCHAQKPDLSDMGHCFVLEWRSVREFKKEFPGAAILNFTSNVTAPAPKWFSNDLERVQIAEYWEKKVVRKRTLLLLKPVPASRENPNPQPVPVYKDELRPVKSDLVLKSREVDQYGVFQHLTNGIELLKTTDWPGRYIPISACLGKVMYIDDGGGAKRKILSMTRLARHPFMLYCYYRTCEAELVGMTPKFPYFVYEGQLSPDELVKLQKSLHEPIAVIVVKPTVEGAPPGQMLGFPQRQPYEPPIAGLEMGAEAARRAIQAAMGISPLPSQAQRQNEKSGKALQQIEMSGQRGSFHFVDNYDGMVRHVGVMVEDLMDKVYDTMRDVGVQKADGTASTVSINDPQNPESVSTEGHYVVTVSTGPSQDSTRERSHDLVDSLMGNIALIGQIAGPKVAASVMAKSIKLEQAGPIADQIADEIDPPKPEGQQEMPPEMQQAMAENQQLKVQLQQAMQALETEQAKQQADVQKTQAEIESKERLAVSEQQAKLEDLARKAQQAEQDLMLKQQELELKREKIASDERIAALNAEIKREASKQGGRKVITKKTLNRTPEGVIVGATEEQEEVDTVLEGGAGDVVDLGGV